MSNTKREELLQRASSLRDRIAKHEEVLNSSKADRGARLPDFHERIRPIEDLVAKLKGELREVELELLLTPDEE